jgi:hypothetical protein
VIFCYAVIETDFHGGRQMAGKRSPGSRKVKLTVAGIIAAAAAVWEAGFYIFANRNLKEILQKGSVKVFFGLITVTEDAALANPHLVAAVFCAALAAGCFIGIQRVTAKPDM